MNNLILTTDSYKLSHFKQYPKGTEEVYSYFESRIGARFNETVFFGLQYLLKKYLEGSIITEEKLERAIKISNAHMGEGVLNVKGWKHIIDVHGGRLPVKIKAVPEGTCVPVNNVMMTIENTDPECYWLTNHLETLLVQTWYPSTVATLSREVKIQLLSYLKQTGNPDLVDFKLHDFGFRGVSSVESAGIGGAAHLINFKGTDTLAAIEFVMDYYNSEMPGFSIPASEHSTMTSWKNEADAMENMLDQYPTGLVACVSDSYDIYNACRNIWGDKLKDKILNRDGVLVVRPDSGDPVEVVLDVINILGDKFGFTVNEQGFKVLNDKVRVIQGDGCSYDTIMEILANMTDDKLSTDNIAFGMGGGLLQKVNRDTQNFAFKCSSVTVNGEERDVYKQPATDPGKNSKRGKLALIRVDGNLITIPGPHKDDILETVFENGMITKEYTFDEVRKNAEIK